MSAIRLHQAALDFLFFPPPWTQRPGTARWKGVLSYLPLAQRAKKFLDVSSVDEETAILTSPSVVCKVTLIVAVRYGVH